MTANREILTPPEEHPARHPDWIHQALEPDQFSTAKPPFGRQALSRRTVVLLWALRVYVVLMVLLVALQTRNAFHRAVTTP